VIFFFCFGVVRELLQHFSPQKQAREKKQLDNSEDVGQKMKKKKKSVFVTVGTTSFDALVEAMDSEEMVQTLIERGYDSLTIQRGRGTYVPKHIVTSTSSERSSAIKVQVVEFLPSLDAILKEASLVISHAGAGSVFESLSLGKPTLVVVNESLMDNHQVELAETLASLGHVAWTKPDGLLQALNAFDPNSLVKYESGECTLAKDIEDFVFL
jgi:beta-1,4-N-acetylglucosaminyltransferase